MLLQTRQLNRRQPVLWVGIAFFSICAIWARADGAAMAGVIFFILLLLNALMLLGKSAILMSEAGILRRDRLGTHWMAWPEIETADTDDVSIVLRGNGKKFPIAPRFWDPETRAPAEAFLRGQLARRNVPLSFNPLSSRAAFGRTRVSHAAAADLLGGAAHASPASVDAGLRDVRSFGVRLFMFSAWLPLVLFLLSVYAVARPQGWGEALRPVLLGRLTFGFSIVMGIIGVAFCAREIQSRGAASIDLISATLVAFSVSLLFMARMLLREWV